MRILNILNDLKNKKFKNIREKRFYTLKDKLEKLRDKRIALYGTGNHTKLLLDYLRNSNLNIVGLIDINKNVIGQYLYNYKVYDLESIKEKIDIIVISSDVYQNVIYERIKHLEKDINIIKIYEEDDFKPIERRYFYKDDNLGINQEAYFDGELVSHISRYIWSSTFAFNKKVLDMACGCGYGTDVLANNANYVVGVDVDKKTIEYANKYFKTDNNEFICSSIERFNSYEQFDLVVSFETIEHIQDDKIYINKIKSVLKTKGMFIVSTPASFENGKSKINKYHINEYTEERFLNLLNNNFEKINLFAQKEFEDGSIVFREALDDIIGKNYTLIAVCYGVIK